MNTNKVVDLYYSATALRDAMLLVHNGTTPDHAKYGAYKTFAGKYNTIAREATKEGYGLDLLSIFDVDKMGSAFNTVWPFQKQVFDSVLVNLLILISTLENRLEIKKNETESIRNFLQSNLRRAVFTTPVDEREVQNAVESILVGRGLQKGIDYDRETGRVKTSSKEVIPDFIFYKQNLACEIKLVKDKTRIGSVIDEINSDIAAYMPTYSGIIFVVYDLGFIRDENEFVSGFSKHENVSCVLVKN